MGLPLGKDGKETHQSRVVRRFAKILKIHLKRPVEFVDEFNSSKEAVADAIKTGISQKKRQNDHHLAAALLLKRFYREKEEE
jgi:RNase H-fold protein (predicted Holliday junction resolvase)